MTLSVREDVQAIGACLEKIEERLDVTEVRIGKLEELAQHGQPASDGTLHKRIEALELQLSKVSPEGYSSNGRDAQSTTAIHGGLGALSSMEEATQWLQDKLWTLYGPRVVETYTKGDFRGLLFAKFTSVTDRDNAVTLLRRACCQENGQQVWMKPDLPIEPRTIKSFLFGMKYQLVQWGETKAAVWADPEAGTLQIGKRFILTATIVDGRLHIHYEAGWEKYLNEAGWTQVADLISIADAKLANKGGKATGKFSGKADGKGWKPSA